MLYSVQTMVVAPSPQHQCTIAQRTVHVTCIVTFANLYHKLMNGIVSCIVVLNHGWIVSLLLYDRVIVVDERIWMCP